MLCEGWIVSIRTGGGSANSSWLERLNDKWRELGRSQSTLNYQEAQSALPPAKAEGLRLTLRNGRRGRNSAAVTFFSFKQADSLRGTEDSKTQSSKGGTAVSDSSLQTGSDEELIGVLMSISVVSLRLARKLIQLNRQVNLRKEVNKMSKMAEIATIIDDCGILHLLLTALR